VNRPVELPIFIVLNLQSEIFNLKSLLGGGSGLVAWPVFKTATETPSVALVGSIPTRSRH
jgi:hypothetical protein